MTDPQHDAIAVVDFGGQVDQIEAFDKVGFARSGLELSGDLPAGVGRFGQSWDVLLECSAFDVEFAVIGQRAEGVAPGDVLAFVDGKLLYLEDAGAGAIAVLALGRFNGEIA